MKNEALNNKICLPGFGAKFFSRVQIFFSIQTVIKRLLLESEDECKRYLYN